MRLKVTSTVKTFSELFEKLNIKEHTLYEVMIKCNSQNPEHKSFLFTGFKNGNYCYCYNNNGDVIRVDTLYSLRIIKELASTK